MQQQPGLIPGVGSSFPHTQRLAPGPPSPPWPQLCEKNAKGAWVPQPCANIHGGTRGSGERPFSARAGGGEAGGEEQEEQQQDPGEGTAL